MNRTEILDNIEQIYPASWGLLFDRSLIIVKAKNNLLSAIDGSENYPAAFYEDLNSPAPGFRDKSRYMANAYAQKTTDILILSEEILQTGGRDLQATLLHELTHCLVDSRDYEIIQLSNDAKKLGKSVYSNLPSGTERITKHNKLFCQLLAEACINYNNGFGYFATPLECMQSALRFDV